MLCWWVFALAPSGCIRSSRVGSTEEGVLMMVQFAAEDCKFIFYLSIIAWAVVVLGPGSCFVPIGRILSCSDTTWRI